MKKIIFSLAAILVLLTSCDDVNMDIDDIPRTLRISVRQITDIDGGWSASDDGSVLVTSSVDTYDGTNLDITVSPKADSYLRKDEVTASISNLGGGYRFAYWLLPSRTEEPIDDESTIGNILYDDNDDGELISLRTNYNEAIIIAAYAFDGKVNAGIGLGATSLDDLTYAVNGSTSVTFTYTINDSNSTRIVKEPRFRLFDENGNAVIIWKEFDDNENVTFLNNETVSYTYVGSINSSELPNWTFVVLYLDPANDNVYVVK